jgi:hypothetical protein
MPIGDREIRIAVDAVAHDVTATLGEEEQVFQAILSRAEELRAFVEDPHEFLGTLAGDVQQWLHDTFRDTSWPTCPQHPWHPLWLREDDYPLAWRCSQDDALIAEVGHLS